MITPELKAKIYELQQEDRWEFLHETNGYTWLRTANNNEIVGMSHTSFLTQEDCMQNARMVGYENMFNSAQYMTWEIYQDSKGDYRWRALSQDGQVVNRSHSAYKSEFAAEKNAVRHGYNLTEQASQTTNTCTLFDCAPKAPPLSVAARLLCIILVAGASLLGLYNQKVAMQKIAMNILDLPSDTKTADCVRTLVHNDILPIYKDENQPHGSFTYVHEVATLEDVAVIIGSYAHVLPKYSEPIAYTTFAMNHAWREFTLPIEEYNQAIATKGSIARTIIDALQLTEAESAATGVLKTFGTFDPKTLASKLDIARMLCALPEEK